MDEDREISGDKGWSTTGSELKPCRQHAGGHLSDAVTMETRKGSHSLIQEFSTGFKECQHESPGRTCVQRFVGVIPGTDLLCSAA